MGEESNVKSRLVAGILGVVCPGLGHVFVGRTLRGVAWSMASIATPLIVYFVLPEMHPFKMAGLLVLAPGVVQLAALVDVVLLPTAKHRAMSSFAMIAFGVVTLLLVIPACIGVFGYLFGPFGVSKSMMTPTLLPGDQLLVDKRVYNLRAPRRGEAVAFTFPDDRSVRFVMRVMAGPSDRFAIEGGHPIINGWRIPSCEAGILALRNDDDVAHEGKIFVEFLEGSAYLVFIDTDKAEIVDDEPPAVVDRDRYRVLGDRRSHVQAALTWSRRNGGVLPAASIEGRPRNIIKNPHLPGVRSWLDLTGAPNTPYSSLDEGIETCLAKRPPLDKTIPPPP